MDKLSKDAYENKLTYSISLSLPFNQKWVDTVPDFYFDRATMKLNVPYAQVPQESEIDVRCEKC